MRRAAACCARQWRRRRRRTAAAAAPLSRTRQTPPSSPPRSKGGSGLARRPPPSKDETRLSGSAGHAWLEAPPRLRTVALWAPKLAAYPSPSPWSCPGASPPAWSLAAMELPSSNPGLRFDRRRRLLGWMPRAAAAGMEPCPAARARAKVRQKWASQGAHRDDHPQRAGGLLAWRAARRGEGGIVAPLASHKGVLIK